MIFKLEINPEKAALLAQRVLKIPALVLGKLGHLMSAEYVKPSEFYHTGTVGSRPKIPGRAKRDSLICGSGRA